MLSFGYGGKVYPVNQNEREILGLKTYPKVGDIPEPIDFATITVPAQAVPKVVVYIGKCFGAARLMMGSLRMGVDFTYSWPCAQVARMAPEEATEIIYKEEINSSNNPDEVRREKLAELIKRYYNYPYYAAEQVMVSELIDPRDTRRLLIRTLENLAHKKPTPGPWRKHSLIRR